MERDKSLSTAGGLMLQMAINIFAGVEIFVVFCLLLLTVSHFFAIFIFDLLQEDMFDTPVEVMALFPHYYS